MTVEAGAAADLARRIRSARPVVHCITNEVTSGRVADALAALGAIPIMASAPEEVAEVVLRSTSLVLNCGTPSAIRWEALRLAGRAAAAAGLPVVLDPVGCGASRWRTEHIGALAREVRPQVVRSNVPELAALLGVSGADELRGVSAARTEVGDVVLRLAAAARASLGAVAVLVTGSPDVVEAAGRVARVPGAAPVLGSVVGAGDVLSAVVGAALAVDPDAFEAARGALAVFGEAAARARDTGPGSYWPRFIDALAAA